jgi:dTDP-L-rhamnose 4-epimerase
MGREEIRPLVLGKYRVGDVRHCFADIEKARRLLGWRPEVAFEQGLEELSTWLAGQDAGADQVARASEELARRGLAL